MLYAAVAMEFWKKDKKKRVYTLNTKGIQLLKNPLTPLCPSPHDYVDNVLKVSETTLETSQLKIAYKISRRIIQLLMNDNAAKAVRITVLRLLQLAIDKEDMTAVAFENTLIKYAAQMGVVTAGDCVFKRNHIAWATSERLLVTLGASKYTSFMDLVVDVVDVDKVTDTVFYPGIPPQYNGIFFTVFDCTQFLKKKNVCITQRYIYLKKEDHCAVCTCYKK